VVQTSGFVVPPRANLERLAGAAGVPTSLLDAVLLPAIRAARLARSARSRSPAVGRPGTEAPTEAFTEAVSEAIRATVEGFAAEMAATAVDQAAQPVDEERVRRTDRAAVERLCAESARAAAGDADRSAELARLALRIAEVSPGDPSWRAGLRSHALAYLANARRVGADLDGAEARRLRIESGASGPLLLPEWRLLDLEASLLRDRRRFGEALELLGRARAAAPAEETARVLLKRASTQEQAGDVEAAILVLREAAPLAETVDDRRVSWGIRFNLATNLCHLGRYREAEDLLPEIRAIAAGLGHELDRLRVLWLSGRIAAGMGHGEEARAAFEEARRHFAARRNGYDAALVTLELAAFDLEEGRTGDVRALSEEMFWILRSHGLGREAMAAVGLFCQAAAAEQATPEMARRLLALLERARRAPRSHFDAGN
jgi:tetratricopeptide (TPR) repeat protein